MAILIAGNYFLVGTTFLIASLLVYFLADIDYKNWELSLWIGVFMVWGFALMQYTILTNYQKLKLLVWGKLLFGELLAREKSYTDFTGTVLFHCKFQYEYQNQVYERQIVISEAYEMDEGKYFLLMINEDEPDKATCIHQFSPSLRAYFNEQFRLNISQAIRNQKLDPTEIFGDSMDS